MKALENCSCLLPSAESAFLYLWLARRFGCNIYIYFLKVSIKKELSK